MMIDRQTDLKSIAGLAATHGRRFAGLLDRNVNRIIAVAVVILALFSLLAWCEARRASELAETTIAATRLSFVAAQRAGVYFQGLQFTPIENDGRPLRWHIAPVWENTGNTATRDLSFELLCPRVSRRLDRERLDPYDLRTTFTPLFVPSLLGPKQAQVGGACELSPEEMERVKDGRLVLYIVAAAHYKDTLDTAAMHETWQCLRVATIDGTFDSTGGTPVSYTALPCSGRPNCADEGCKKAPK